MPQLTIGMPVYNGEKTIVSAIESVLGQTFRDFVLLISDNASSDRTPEICENYSLIDPRVLYCRQPCNIGGSRNFQYVLDAATTDLFTWWAADDFRTPGFLEACVRHLALSPESICSTAVSVFGSDTPSQEELCHAVALQLPRSKSNTPESRVLSFLDVCWHSHSIFYSVFRRSSVMHPSLFDSPDYLAKDWIWNLYLLSVGRVHFSDGETIFLGVHGVSNARDTWRSHRSRKINWLLPFYQLSTASLFLSRNFKLNSRIRILLWLFRLNIFGFKHQALTVIRSAIQAFLRRPHA